MELRLEELKNAVKEQVMGSIDFSRDISDEEMYELIDRQISSQMRHMALPLETRKKLRLRCSIL